MWAFLDKFINIVLPRVRDFRGLSRKAFDNSGNYSVGIVEHTIFPEVNPNTTKGVRNLQVTVVTDAKDKEESEKLLSLLGLPLKK
jgi:large subunit ribosomal protein L5